CNSVLATRLALTYGDYVITEAGFGADLGAEKFYNIKCRKSGLQPALTILVATTQGLKMHGGVPVEEIKQPHPEGLKEGLRNLDRHIANLQSFGQTVVVCFNRFATDTDEEIDFCRQHCNSIGVGFAVNNAFNEGGSGAEELARLVVDTIDNKPSAPLQFTYPDEASVEEKALAVCQKIYGADGVTFSPQAKKMIERIKELGITNYPICIAKTQYSFSADAKAYGCPTGFNIHIRDIVVNCGAEMLVLVAGDIMRMPGLPRSPQAERIDLIDGEIVGLS
ncbi:MAG: formate--tetrahydrofolate ligase, partial [Bacteroidaceae bacterium]|nr:formate--tetrahydrofolate ligase [Bacteroidaceae bacterium]